MERMNIEERVQEGVGLLSKGARRDEEKKQKSAHVHPQRLSCLADKVVGLAGGKRGAEQESLHAIASLLLQKLELLSRFHTFRSDFQPQRVRQVDDVGDDGRRGFVAGHVLYEGLVDLDGVDGELFQIDQRRMAR